MVFRTIINIIDEREGRGEGKRRGEELRADPGHVLEAPDAQAGEDIHARRPEEQGPEQHQQLGRLRKELGAQPIAVSIVRCSPARNDNDDFDENECGDSQKVTTERQYD